MFILSNSATPLYVSWQRDIGFSQSTLTWIFAVYIVGLLASLLVSGPLSDRIGRKPVLLPALALSLISCAIFLSASSVTALIMARLLTGISVGAIVSCGMAAVADIAGPHRKKLAALLSSSAMVFGSGVGPLFSGIVAEVMAAPIIPVFSVVLALILVSFALVGKMPLHSRRQAGPLVRVPGVPRKAFVHLILAIAVFAPGLSGTSFFLSLGPSLLYEITGNVSTAIAGILVFLTFASATGVQFAAQRFSPARLLAIGVASTAMGMVMLFSAVTISSSVMIFVAATFIGAGQGAGQLAGFTLLNLIIPSTRLAEANSALSVGAYVPAATLSLIAGRVSDATSIETSAITLSVILIIIAAFSAAAIFLFRRRIKQ
ncbi:MFS transporter [Streptomyces sp. MS1.AVA.4]|uniref:MFS transporter n=1 Tax=Streptomyces pratisoli TaxID=3139917 RepID=A0ACC6QUU3_9ACTN